VFLSFGELPKDEQPPRRIWTNNEALAAHFEQVERNREARFKDKEIEGDVAENDAAKLLIAG
jgi:hypothetical protein